MKVIRDFYPNFRKLAIHESSPVGRGASSLLRRECPFYSSSHYFPEIVPGQTHPRVHSRCENLEALTFPDSSFDLFVTQDVMEHVFDPEAAFREICRVLKPGGAHVFTVPLVNKTRPSRRRAAVLPDGQIIHYCKAQYHGNPIDAKGALVTIDWGYDVVTLIQQNTGMPSMLVQMDNIDLGIRAELNEVLVSVKTNSDHCAALEPYGKVENAS